MVTHAWAHNSLAVVHPAQQVPLIGSVVLLQKARAHAEDEPAAERDEIPARLPVHRVLTGECVVVTSVVVFTSRIGSGQTG